MQTEAKVTDSRASAFDPTDSLHALGEIQRRGFDAARELVDRFIAAIGDGHSNGNGETADDRPQSGDALDAWVQLMGRSVEAFAEALRTVASEPDRVHVVVDRQADGPALRGCAPVWVHNTTESELADLRPHCGELRSSSGTVLACDVAFEPACVERLAAASRQSVLMRITGVDRAAPGDVYRGIVQIAGLADTVLAVECEVTA
jgi:hypothetical protein